MRLTAATIAATTTVLLGLGASSLAGASSAAPPTKNPNEKTTVTDIQWRISYSREIPGNCAVLGFSQWQAAKLKGWVPYQVAITVVSRVDSFPVSAPPKYDDELRYGGNVVSPPAGSHWVLIGDGSYRAGGPPAEADCEAILARSKALTPDGKVTTSFRRTPLCATKFDRLTAAQAAAKRAKSKKAKATAKTNRVKAEKAFAKDCSK